MNAVCGVLGHLKVNKFQETILLDASLSLNTGSEVHLSIMV